MPQTTSRVLGAILFAACTLGSASCVGYGTYPKSAGPLYPSAVNSAAGEEIMRAAILWAGGQIERDTGGRPTMVVNFPAEIAPYRAYRVAAAAGPGVEVLDRPERLGTDVVVHIGRIAVRGSDAEIDVYRPVFTAYGRNEGAPDEPIYQNVTLTLKGGLDPWHVERTRPWTPGAFYPPEPNVIERPR